MNLRNKAGRVRESVPPFLKWPGGKRWACPMIVPIVRQHLKKKYYEPFLGGGAVFFALRPECAILSDTNPELIQVYRNVRARCSDVITALKTLPVDAETYRQIRKTRGETALANAVRLLYLNRTAFGGMYRLNKRGEFNVPYGGGERSPEILWRRQLLQRAATALRGAALFARGFEHSLRTAEAGDVVYCDPTYTVMHETNNFRRYNESNFSWSDQELLARLCKKATGRGVVVIVSNAYHDEIRKLYHPYQPMILTRNSLLAPDAEFRRPVKECLFILGR
jgi:DNA adenine methylase